MGELSCRQGWAPGGKVWAKLSLETSLVCDIKAFFLSQKGGRLQSLQWAGKYRSTGSQGKSVVVGWAPSGLGRSETRKPWEIREQVLLENNRNVRRFI